MPTADRILLVERPVGAAGAVERAEERAVGGVEAVEAEVAKVAD